MKISKNTIKRLIRETMEDYKDQFGEYTLDPEESAWADRDDQADQMIIDDVEATYEALMEDLDSVEDPRMKADIIRMFQDALRLD